MNRNVVLKVQNDSQKSFPSHGAILMRTIGDKQGQRLSIIQYFARYPAICLLNHNVPMRAKDQLADFPCGTKDSA